MSTVERSQSALAPGHTLHWYEIRTVLGRGGFGITYLARDTNLDHLVAIKEYLPPDLAVRTQHDTVHPRSESREEVFRWGLDRFIREARTLVKFKHPNIVTVHSIFEANGTAYMVMEFERGIDLEQAVKAGVTLGEEELLGIIHPLLDGLAMVHEHGFIHRDIKPENLLLRKDGSPVLLDFGSARESMPSDPRTLTSLVTPGFAPFEQYQDARHSDKQGPWSDIYSLAATIYRVVTGEGPTDALTRVNAIVDKTPDPYKPAAELARERYSAQFLHAIDAALRFGVAERPQSIEAWRAMLPAGGRLPDVKAAADASLAWAEWEGRMGGSGEAVEREEQARAASRRATLAREKETHRAWWLGLLLILFLGGVGIWQGTRRTQVVVPPPKDAARGSGVRTQAAQARIDALLSAATDAIVDVRLTTPEGDNAYLYYRQVLDLDPDNAQAVRGLALIVARYVSLAQSAVAAGEFDKAERYLDSAAGVMADDPGVESARGMLKAARASQAARAAVPAAGAVVPPGAAPDAAGGTVARIAVLPFWGASSGGRMASEQLDHGVQISEFTHGFLRNTPGLETVYSFYLEGFDHAAVKRAGDLWRGDALHKEPDAARVRELGRDLGADAVLVYGYVPGPGTEAEVDAYLVAVGGTGGIFHRHGEVGSLAEITRGIFDDWAGAAAR